MNVTTTHN